MCKKILKLSGKIVKGVNKASYFTGLNWVQDQCKEKLGFRPYTGTLNLQIDPDCFKVLDQLQDENCKELLPPDQAFCAAKVLPVTIESEKAALLIPDENVRVHGAEVIELIAPNRLKDALDVDDGDFLTVLIDDYGK